MNLSHGVKSIGDVIGIVLVIHSTIARVVIVIVFAINTGICVDVLLLKLMMAHGGGGVATRIGVISIIVFAITMRSLPIAIISIMIPVV